MLHRTLSALAVLSLFVASSALAQMSGSTSGEYTTHITYMEETEHDDGTMTVMNHYRQASFAEGEHPIDNTVADCVGMLTMSGEGMPTAGSGMCFSKNAEGDGASFWWRYEQAGTAECPTMCGVWGYFAGTGNFKGITGNGTWQQTANFGDGAIGTWTGSYKMGM